MVVAVAPTQPMGVALELPVPVGEPFLYSDKLLEGKYAVE